MNKGSRDKGIAQPEFLVPENQEGTANNNVFSPLTYENPSLKKQEDYNDGDEGDGGSGSIALSVEQSAYFQALLNILRRQHDGQGKFGNSPFSEDPNKFLGKKGSRSCVGESRPHPHPLFAHSQQFSGDDPKICAIPSDNPEARERFSEKRLENQLHLQKKLGLGASKSVTLAR